MAGHHTARFGEIEQRGVALTQKGRALYDRLLAKSQQLPPAKDNSAHQAQLAEVFQAFPDDHATLRREGLAFFHYHAVPGTTASLPAQINPDTLDALIEQGALTCQPMIYEDFLPVSAAGIFQSNLGGEQRDEYASQANQAQFERDLGASVIDEIALYEQRQQASLDKALAVLGLRTNRSANEARRFLQQRQILF